MRHTWPSRTAFLPSFRLEGADNGKRRNRELFPEPRFDGAARQTAWKFEVSHLLPVRFGSFDFTERPAFRRRPDCSEI